MSTNTHRATFVVSTVLHDENGNPESTAWPQTFPTLAEAQAAVAAELPDLSDWFRSSDTEIGAWAPRGDTVVTVIVTETTGEEKS